MIAAFFSYFLIFFLVSRLISETGGNKIPFLVKTTVKQDVLKERILYNPELIVRGTIARLKS
ncbi:hypothetical protein ABES25_23915 [Bacillus gobiensis]|uniref:hypothetical protein n=1 Tax=Bacillus gobiensis TaxID=1441095 RepID=UPI003D1C5227